MIRIKEVIVVEGRYDKAALASCVDAVILDTAGFGIFTDGEKLDLMRRLAQRRGLIVLTDSDGGGFVIRNFLKSAIDPALVKHAYIPDLYGKEKRKSSPSKEGKLGVEGMRPDAGKVWFSACGKVQHSREIPSRRTTETSPCLSSFTAVAINRSDGSSRI